MNVNEILSRDYIPHLEKRFIKYVSTYSESNGEKADNNIIPSAECEWDMANLLKDELISLGLKDVQITDHCYTYGYLEASEGYENKEPFCLLAHIDTVDEVSGLNVKPQIFRNYDGSAISLNNNVIHDPSSDEKLALAGKERDTIITSDGTTLLGADDKAGVAAIVTAVEYLKNHPEIKHGPVEVIFSPDEETGHGMDYVPLNLLKSRFAYTVDGGHIGELETECFNAWKSEITFTGISTHTGTARGKMINAVNMASAFVQNLPKHEMPETTCGYEGFYAPMSITGSIESAQVSLLLRDFNREEMKKRIAVVEQIASSVASVYGGKVTVKNTQQYLNMKDKLDENPSVAEKLLRAFEKCDITPSFTPIRGGTDGSRLTEMGIPCPNMFTGGHNFHSLYEWVSLSQMAQAVKVLIELMTM